MNANIPFNFRRKSGFTLIELLLAIAILALVISLIYPAYRGTVGNIPEVRDEADLFQVARLILERVSRELTSAFVAPARVLPGKTQEKSYSFFVGTDAENGDYPFDTLRFTATVSTGQSLVNTRESDLVVIEYLPDPNPEPTARGTILWRRESSIISQNLAEESKVMEMGEFVKGIDYKFYDTNAGEYVPQWNSETRVQGQTLLPSAIMVTVFLLDAKNVIRPFSTVIKIPINRLKEVQVTAGGQETTGGLKKTGGTTGK